MPIQIMPQFTLPGAELREAIEKARERAMKRPLMEAQAEESHSQAERNKKLSELPFAGRELPGAAGKALAIQMIKMKYGENSPEYEEAKSLYDLEKRRSEQTINYQQSLMDSQGKRFASAEGKRAQELGEIEQGNMPGSTVGNKTGQRLTPEQQAKLKGQYNLKALKNATDTDVLKRIRYSKNMEKTLDNLNVDDLVSYSGLKGTGELLKDKYQATQNNVSPRYKKYEKSLVAAKLLSKQVRQFYGDSITPEVQKELKKLTNPTTWLTHPEVAKSNFNQFKKILKSEAKTFTDAARNADIYEDMPEESSQELNYNIETGDFE